MIKYKLFLPATGSKQPPIPDDERLEAAARIFVHEEDPNVVAAELFERHGRDAPKHGRQAFSAFMRKINRLVEEGDEDTIEKCHQLGFDVRAMGEDDDEVDIAADEEGSELADEE